MEITEIILLVAGGIIFVLSFFIPEKKNQIDNQSRELAKEEISGLVKAEMDNVRGHVDDVVGEAVEYAMEKTERSLERLSNEKIMAVNEYSDTVLAEIHKNHEEAMFLYDMLNSKHSHLKDTVTEVNRTVKEAEETVTGFQKLVPELVEEKKENTTQLKDQETEINHPAGLDRDGTMPENGETNHNKNEKILELYQQGESKVAIARELGLGVGEVKLVIDLYRNQ